MQAIKLKNDIRPWKVPIRELGHFLRVCRSTFFSSFRSLKHILKSFPSFLTVSGSDNWVFPRLSVREKSTASFRCPPFLFQCIFTWLWVLYFLIRPLRHKLVKCQARRYKLIDSGAFNVTEAWWRTVEALKIFLIQVPLRHKAKPSYEQVCLHLTVPLWRHSHVALTHEFIFQEEVGKKKKFSFLSLCAYPCVWALLQEFQGRGPYYACGMRNQHLRYKKLEYVNAEATIIRRRGVGELEEMECK